MKLVKWTGQVLANDGAKEVPEILSDQGTGPESWTLTQSGHALSAATALGSPAALQDLAERRGKRSIRGIGVARCLAG